MVRVPLAFLLVVAFASAQSHPSWWTYASPEATALVGIDWQDVRTSPFADPIEAELWGDLGFPDLPCLHNARQILISSPELLALASGNFPVAALRDQAAKRGLKAMTYRNIDMWFATEKGALSIARFSDQLVIIGDAKALQAAVDRSMSDSKNYSPLLARAAQFAQKDLWVVASQLPDDLANRFVPLDTEAQSFEGSVSVRNGLEMEAVLSAASAQQATASAEKLRKAVPALPAIARGLQVTAEDDAIFLSLAASREQIVAALRGPDPVPAPVETIRMETPKGVEQIVIEKPEPPKPLAVAVEKPVEKPQVIRIFGLDDGPREIVLPKPEKQNL
ncbi:MAG TPA: hypothetical protein VNU44_05445 [Bryobacteraceae bacterium]|jgi:hypothetical protein|nr:hypothetical protein [Bryobacteraceae bacterium]